VLESHSLNVKESEMASVRILIADDHEVVRRGVRSLLSSRMDWDICGEAVDGRDAVVKAKALKPDVIVLDISMPHLNGLEAARLIRKEVPQSEILILSQHDAKETMQAAMEAGARGYVTKTDIARDLLKAVDAVSRHQQPVSSRSVLVPEQRPTERDASGHVPPLRGPLEGITEGERAEAARVWLAAIVESSDDAIISKNVDGVITSWNAAAERIFGYTETEAVGQSITIIVPPELHGEEKQILKRLLQGERIEHYETVRITKQGQRVDVALTISPLRDYSGRIIGASKIAHDFTERKRAEAALRESEERMRFSLETANFGTWTWNIPTGEVQWSDNMEKIHGQEPGSFGGGFDGFLQGVHIDDREKVLARIKQAIAGDGNYYVQYRQLRADGTVGWMEANARVIYDDAQQPLRMIGVCMNITERKQAEEELRQAQQELEARVKERTAELERRTTQVLEQAELLDLANDAICVRTLDDKITYWNRGAERLYGWTKGEVLGKPITEILRTEFPQPFAEVKAQLLREGSWQGELTHSTRDGRRISVASRWSVWFKEGTPFGFLELSTDISDRKRAEESLRAMSGRLLQMQDEERRRIARELHDSAGQTLVALDMNLARIEAEAERLSPNAVGALTESVEFLQQLSKELRTISHLLHPPLLDEAGLPSAIRWYVEGFAERSQIPVNLELSPELGRLTPESETTIFRIVQECLTNIHRHSGSPTASIRITRNSEQVQVEIRDQGKGLAPESQLASSSLGRTGVGIQGMRERIRQLGGHFQIHSTGSGTIVLATLPVAGAMENSHTAKIAS